MLKVEAIENNSTRNSRVIPVAKGAAAGALTGMVLKYAQPLTSEEKNTAEYRKALKDIHNGLSTHSEWSQDFVDKIKNHKNLSSAEDVFVKTFDGIKISQKPKYSKIKQAFKLIKPEDKGEFKQLIKHLKMYKLERAQRALKINDLVTKYIRPTQFFLVSGAIIGAFVSLVHNILKTDI